MTKAADKFLPVEMIGTSKKGDQRMILLDIYFTASILIGLTLMSAMWANFSNIFRSEKEDNIIFHAISYLPKKVLKFFGVKVTYFNVFICSYLLGILIITVNIIIIWSS